MQKFEDIQLQRIAFLRGPNIWTYRPVLEVWLDLGALEDFPSNLIPGLTERLLTALPALGEHHCGVGEKGGFLQRLQEGTWAGHILEHVVIELLNLADMPTGFGQTRSTSKRGVYRMVFRARDEQVARLALEEGHRLLMCAINTLPFDTPAAVQRLRDRVEGRHFALPVGRDNAVADGRESDPEQFGFVDCESAVLWGVVDLWVRGRNAGNDAGNLGLLVVAHGRSLSITADPRRGEPQFGNDPRVAFQGICGRRSPGHGSQRC